MIGVSAINATLPRKSQANVTELKRENKHQTFGSHYRNGPEALQPRPPTDATSVSCCHSTDDSLDTATLLWQKTISHLTKDMNAGHTAQNDSTFTT